MALLNGFSTAALPLFVTARLSTEFQPSLGTRGQIKVSVPGPVGLGLRLQPIERRLSTPSAFASGQTRTNTLEAPTRTITSAYANEKSPTRTPKKNIEVSATLRNIHMSPHKVRRALDPLVGRTYEDVLMILEFMPYRACEPIFKVIYSAGANGVHNLGLNEGSLVISKAYVNEGPKMKRTNPRARGRTDMIQKPTCSITVFLKDTSLDA